MLAAADRLIERGGLHRCDDVFDLTLREIDRALASDIPPAGMLARVAAGVVSRMAGERAAGMASRRSGKADVAVRGERIAASRTNL